MVEMRQTARRFLARAFSDESLTKRALLSSLASGLDFSARLVIAFILNPILLVHLGDAGFGTWQVLKRLIGHATPATGRASEALKWSLARRQASTDFDEKRQQVGSAIAAGLVFVPILAILGGVMAWFAPTWLATPPSAYTNVRLAIAILVANLILTNLTQIPRSVLSGENLEYKRVGLSTLVLSLGGVLSIAAVIQGAGIVGLALATVATTLLSGLLLFRVVRHYVAWFGIAKPSLQAVGQFLRLSGWFLVWSLVIQMMTGSDIIVLGIAGSTEQVTSYTLARYFPTLILSVGTISIFGMLPGLGGLIGAGDHQRAANVRKETLCFIWLLATVAGMSVLLWEQSFLQLWVGRGYYPGSDVMLLIVLMILQFSLIRTDSNIIDLTLNLRWKVILGLVSTSLSVALAWIALAGLGLGMVGFLGGFIVGRLIQSFSYPWMVGRILQIPLETQLRGLVRPGLVAAIGLGTTWLAGEFVNITSWPLLIVAAAASIAALTPITFLAGLSRQQRQQVWTRARRLLRLV